MPVTIRPAQASDAPAIARIQIDSYRSAYAGILPEAYLTNFTLQEQTQDWLDWPRLHPEDLLLVADMNGEIWGYALARPQGDLKGIDSELLALHIRRAGHKQGVGRTLVRAAAAGLAARGCSSLIVWVLAQNPARGFYQRLGGRLLASRWFDYDDEGGRAEEVAYGWPDIQVLTNGQK